MTHRVPILDLSPADLDAHLDALDEPRYRATQILEWVYQNGVTTFDAMTNLPTRLRRRLAESFVLRVGRQLARSETPDGTIKLLLQWLDGATTETVMIPGPEPDIRRTVCLSTQVGCDVGCRFCASGIGGSLRDLTVGEIIEQALVVRELLSLQKKRLSHVVFMGMGEPLANYEATVEAARRVTTEWGLGLAQRRVTLSTVGLPKQIERLATEELQITLALSLHAPNEELRRQLIPWAKAISLTRLLEACRTYRRKTGREITLEYCLLAGVNDQKDHATELAAIARSLEAHINLLVYNPVAGLPYERPSRNRSIGFLRRLRGLGAKVHLRESRGLEVDAACGQLRRRAAE